MAQSCHELEWVGVDKTSALHPLPLPVAAWIPLPDVAPAELLTRLGGQWPFLLESANGTDTLARYSFIGADPCLTLRLHGNQLQMTDADGAPLAVPDGSPLQVVRALLSERRYRRLPEFPPFIGGFAGVISYDFVRHLERLPVVATDDLNLPELDLSFYTTVVALDHQLERLWVIHLPQHDDRDQAAQHVQAVMERISSPLVVPVELSDGPVGPVTHPMQPAQFEQMVATAREFIAAGDIFQANLSHRFEAAYGGDPQALYRVLTRINPAPFAACIERNGYALVCSSPERLVSLRQGRVEARPIAGTRPRGTASDRAVQSDLLGNAKERAEHVMLVDLMRNDLGRVCDYGSVQVSEFMVTEAYSHVIHIVSNVVGTLGPGKDAVSVLRAVFPGGTITGAPKVRCMEIIEQLEPTRRGVYTGSAGYLSVCGNMDLNILIRTLLVKDDTAYFQTGAGIVAESDPAREYDETLHKAAAMRRALEQLAACPTGVAAAP